jgi:hypothetical protein
MGRKKSQPNISLDDLDGITFDDTPAVVRGSGSRFLDLFEDVYAEWRTLDEGNQRILNPKKFLDRVPLESGESLGDWTGKFVAAFNNYSENTEDPTIKMGSTSRVNVGGTVKTLAHPIPVIKRLGA